MPPVTSSWLIGSLPRIGPDHQLVHQRAEQRHQQDAEREGPKQRHAVVDIEEVDRVHADHHQLGVADPDHVDHAEDQVQPERQQRQHPAEQDSVQDRLEQEDVEDRHGARPPPARCLPLGQLRPPPGARDLGTAGASGRGPAGQRRLIRSILSLVAGWLER
jgi:hypothetical protein